MIEATATVICDLCSRRNSCDTNSNGARFPMGWYRVEIQLAGDTHNHVHPTGECPFDSTSHICPTCISRVRRALQPIKPLESVA
jgi:hypothetical protein